MSIQLVTLHGLIEPAEEAPPLADHDSTADWEAPPEKSGGEADDDGTVNPDSQPGGELWNPDEFLPPAEPAPALANRGAAICKAVDLIQLVAPIVILLCLRDGRESFATRAVWDLVPEPKPRYRRLNAVGDVLGRGAGKQSLGLYRDSQGNFICCRENVCLAAHRMTPAGLKALALRLGFPTRTDFELAVNSLPSAQVGTPM
jgi:hypothetical protein